MANATFVLPSINAAGMSKDDQGALIVNQATAIIVTEYLQYAQHMHDVYLNKMESGYLSDSGTSVNWDRVENLRILTNELPGLIDSVQDALKSF